MKIKYVIDELPFDKLSVECQKDYGKIWYCHMKGFPDVAVFGSVGTKRHAQSICDMYNHKSRGERKEKDNEILANRLLQNP